MKKFESKRQLKSRLYSRTTVTLLFLLILLLAKGVFAIYVKSRDSALMRDAAYVKLEEIKNRKKIISGEVTNLNIDQGIEREIREKFNVVKPGEKVVLIVDDEALPEIEPKKRFFSSLWHGLWD